MARPEKYDWHNIRLDLELGMAHEYIYKKYEVPYCAINKHLRRNPLKINQVSIDIVEGFDKVSQQISQLKETNPELASRTIDIIQSKHPIFKKAMVNISVKLFKRINALSDEATAGDITSLAKGMQTITDTLGISQRHAPRQDISLKNEVQNTKQINIVYE